MNNENLAPSRECEEDDNDINYEIDAFISLSLHADWWRLATAIYLVTQRDGCPLPTRDTILENLEGAAIYQLAEASIRAERLKGEFDEKTNDYWVNPDDFLKWCIEKHIRCDTGPVKFYL